MTYYKSRITDYIDSKIKIKRKVRNPQKKMVNKFEEASNTKSKHVAENGSMVDANADLW